MLRIGVAVERRPVTTPLDQPQELEQLTMENRSNRHATSTLT